MNKKGFTLIELLAVIVILAIVTVLGVTTVLPYMSDAREKAFRLDATNVVKSAKDAVNLYNLNKITLNGNESCKKASSNEYCFTVLELVNLGIFDGDGDAYTGKVLVDATNSQSSTYTLYLKKNDEFKIIGGFRENYKDFGALSTENWSDDYTSCDCSE